MPKITQTNPIANLPVAELDESLRAFLEPVTNLLPDVRLRAVAELMVRGIITSQSPIMTQVARGAGYVDEALWPACQRLYRFLANARFSYRVLRKGLYRQGQATVVAAAPEYLVIAVDPVNFEKPYTHALEGVSRVMKSTPPSLSGEKRLTRGYPAITASVVNLSQPVITYAEWFSYTTAGFLSQNREIERALHMSRALFPREKLRFVGDSGLDDQKIFVQAERFQSEFIFRSAHERRVEVYNPRLQRWESELLSDLVASVPFEFEQDVRFTHARAERQVHLAFGWFEFRLPETTRSLWALVAHDVQTEHDLVLLTNIPLRDAATVRQVYADWRLRPNIEHTYRFDQEEGLDVEDMRVETLERMRRVFIMVLLAAQFIHTIGLAWPPPAVLWLRQLGGKLGLCSDRDGLYILMRGISAVWQTAATLALLAKRPFPRAFSRCV